MKTVMQLMVAGLVLAGEFVSESVAQTDRVVIGIGAEGVEAGTVRIAAPGIEPLSEGLTRSSALREARGNTFNTSGFAPSIESIEDARALEQFVELRFQVGPDAGAIVSALDLAFDISKTGPKRLAVEFREAEAESSTVVFEDMDVDSAGETHMDVAIEEPLHLTEGEWSAKIYAYGAKSARGTLDFEDLGANFSIVFRGPEPE